MSRTSLILTDTVFVVVLVTSYKNGDLKSYPIILVPFIVAAFATCIIRHVNYYHITKRIY